MRIVPVEGKDLPLVKKLLENVGLSWAGIEDQFEHFLKLMLDGELVAVAGLEVYDHVGLMRSVAVAQEYRHSGLGRGLTRAMINKARSMGLERLYVLTETASIIFIALVSVLSIARRFMRRCWGQNSFALCAHPMLFLCTSNCKAPRLLAEGPCRFDTVILGLNASCIKQCQFLLPKVKLK